MSTATNLRLLDVACACSRRASTSASEQIHRLPCGRPPPAAGKVETPSAPSRACPPDLGAPRGGEASRGGARRPPRRGKRAAPSREEKGRRPAPTRRGRRGGGRDCRQGEVEEIVGSWPLGMDKRRDGPDENRGGDQLSWEGHVPDPGVHRSINSMQAVMVLKFTSLDPSVNRH